MSQFIEVAVRRELIRRLAAYLTGTQSRDDLQAWEAERSLSPEIGPVRDDLDRLALVIEEVSDGLRDESELRQLSVEVLSRQSFRVMSAGSAYATGTVSGKPVTFSGPSRQVTGTREGPAMEVTSAGI